tara:strand:+ start:3141 stop:3722 length:582 start_codon:yes stop_codon:yes gene_type:complete
MKEVAICSPETYGSVEMQEYIRQRCVDKDKQWIYKLIRGEGGSEKECVYIDDGEFMLCRDLHPGTDERYLILFKNLRLQTIRDLRREHLGMLRRVQARTKEFLEQTLTPAHASQYRIFFHYTPSVFQLHAHVSVANAHTQSTRVHPLHIVARHLAKKSTYYRDALILISLCKSMKALQVYKGMFGGAGDGYRK